MHTTMIFEAEEDVMGGADEVDGPEEDRHDVTNIVTHMELVRILVTSVVPQPRGTKQLLRFRISRAERQRIVPPDNSGQN